MKLKPNRLDSGLEGSLRSSRSTTPTPAISIEPDGSLELTADMINGIDNEVITSDTLQSARARGSNNTELGVIITSDDESVDGEALLLLEEEEEEEEGEEPEEQVEKRVNLVEEAAVRVVMRGGVGEGRAEATTEDTLPGSTPKRGSAESRTSEEECGHDHERTPQPSDHQERTTLEEVKDPANQKSTDHGGSPTDNVSRVCLSV